MSLTKEQLQLIDSCPALKGLKSWFIAVDTTVNPNNNTNSTNDTPTTKTYSFTSYADAEGETEWDTGTVETTGVTSNGYTQVEVITNTTHQEFVGQKFYISSDAEANNTTIYPLYTDAGTTSAEIYVKISEE